MFGSRCDANANVSSSFVLGALCCSSLSVVDPGWFRVSYTILDSLDSDMLSKVHRCRKEYGKNVSR